MAKRPTKKGVTKAPKPKKTRVPKTRGGDRYTESGYFGFIRSGLRAKWVRWPVRYDVLNESKVPYDGPDKRTKFLYKCAICGGKFKQKEVEVDHYPVACGSLRCFEDLPHFVSTLFCEKENLRVVCKSCHTEYSNEQRKAKKSVDTEDNES